MIVYIAGPYTKGDVAQNVRNAILAADHLIGEGHVPYIPHLTHFWHLLSPKPYEFWIDYDLLWLEKCDCILRLQGESAGADMEVVEATRLGKPVYHSIRDIGGMQ